MNEKVHFSITMKALGDFELDTTQTPIPQTIPLRERVKPLGDYYFINPAIPLQDDDWVIYGVASTSHVDLQNDIANAQDIFGDYLEEFVQTGKIYYEHGYRLAKDASPSNRIDEPIGYPYMVEIYNNELWIWAILDKSHPLAQKVWESMNNSDARFRNKWGFSIGAITLQKPSFLNDSKFGRVRALPKLRLFEISVTPQPMNMHTWADIVKSLAAEEDMDTEQETKLKDEVVDVKSGEKVKKVHEKSPQSKQGSPEADRKDLDETVDVTKAVGEENDEEKTKEPVEDKEAPQNEEAVDEQNAEQSEGDKVIDDLQDALGDENSQNKAETPNEGETTPPAANEAVNAKEQAPEGEAPESTEGGQGEEGDKNVLMDLLGEEGDSGDQADEGGDASMELILDKLDMLSDRLDELSQKFAKLFDTEIQEHGEEVLENSEENTEEEQSPKVSEEVFAKSMLEVLDTIDLLRKSVESKFAEQEKLLTAVVKSVETSEVITAAPIEKSAAEKSLEARENFHPEESVTKSISTENAEIEVPEEGNSGNKVLKSLSERIEDVITSGKPKNKYEKILQDESLLEITKSLTEALHVLDERQSDQKISPATYRTKRQEIFELAHELLGLNRPEFLALVSQE